ncbi:GNAT family N-acetyltransferase [Loktanella sp. SALINAS62]|uniref:GNAT family N-acetyltransferase n=1 Tax=Loktanella sp. SALINAS62 TaxID=2706124 RepID=UPI001B8C5CDE|nr:GNAT family N-acetyltransferase [Loktanella sp. SALINAS62]MBS1301330.1 GNAT family N-acetyltransferase [Loktanella sp. SALINAS62]
MTPDALATLHAVAFTTDRPWSAHEFKDLLSQTGAVLAGDYRAFALGRFIAPELEILTVACHPDHRRQGLARKAVMTILDQAQMRGAETVFLEVASDNIAARTLYDALGFAKVGQRRGYYQRADGPPVDALVLSKAIVPSNTA